MNARAILRLVLLLVVVGSLVVWVARRGSPPRAAPDPAAAAAAAQARVLVTYFTTDVRCASCKTIEELSRRAVLEGFAAEVARGEVAFRVVNTDRPEHRHFVDRYEITNKVVIVSRQVAGEEVEWTPRQDVWLHFDEPDEFFAYVREPIRTYLRRT